jgi:hypothetical protein
MSLIHGAHFVFDPPSVTNTASLCVGSRISLGLSVPLVSNGAVPARLVDFERFAEAGCRAKGVRGVRNRRRLRRQSARLVSDTHKPYGGVYIYSNCHRLYLTANAELFLRLANEDEIPCSTATLFS